MVNIVNRLKESVAKDPQHIALKFPRRHGDSYTYQTMSFAELEIAIDQYASYYTQIGITRGKKVIFFVRPCLEFTAMVFALFKVGAIPVLIDPGMGRKNLLNAIAQVKPDALIAVPIVHLLRLLFRSYFRSIKIFVTTGWFRWPGMFSLYRLLQKKRLPTTKVVELAADEMAALLFTSGGTGIPKGVVYTHKIFLTQTAILQRLFNLTAKDIDLPGFPLFSLFTVTMGMTSCTPDMDPAKPAQCDPKRLVQNIIDNSCSFVAGSPAIWQRVADYCLQNSITLPSVKYLVMFGAPVPNILHKKFQQILPNGTTYTPYGATESLPVANISGSFILEHTAQLTDQGKGTCVGKPVDEVKLKIIKISDSEISKFDQVEELPCGEIGEIIVQGDMVTKEYYLMPEQTALAKIYDSQGRFWHRIGDIGYLDQEGKLWFCGRKSYRVELAGKMLSSVQCEAIFNTHSAVARSALVRIDLADYPIAAIVIELKDRAVNKEQLIKELKELGQKYEHTKDISYFFFHSHFPVDVRHNIKIDRRALQQYAKQQFNQGLSR
jgi:acyl-CoA synthetase (AMP-forming)/AMP-acid ligase II